MTRQLWLESLPFYDDLVVVMGEYDESKDYVGAEGDWKAKIIPRTIWGIDVNMAAYVHDYKYAKGGDAEAKFQGDSAFMVDMLRLIFMADSWKITKSFAILRAAKYYLAVRTDASKKAFAWKVN